jgi:hypothetical protein
MIDDPDDWTDDDPPPDVEPVDDDEIGPLARNSDPSTSHDAAAGEDSREARAHQRARLEVVFADAYPDPLIAWEAGDRSGLAAIDGTCYWHRVGDLRKLGAIARLLDKRRSPATGKAQFLHVWVPPPQRPTREQRQARAQPGGLGADLETALLAVAEVRDTLPAGSPLAAKLTAALALVKGFRDWAP